MKINKTAAVKKHLLINKRITSWEAITLYRATRLSAIIFNLKAQGLDITTELVKGDEPYGIYHLK